MRLRVNYPRRRRNANAERDAELERQAGIPDRTEPDARRICTLDLRGAGGRWVNIVPLPGKHAWLAVDVLTGHVLGRGALKTLVHDEAARMPRMTAPGAVE